MKKFFITSTFLCLAGATNAADLAPRPYAKAPAPMVGPAYDWTGFYVGVMGGYGWSDRIRASNPFLGAVTVTSDDLKGGFGGGTIGYNWQVNQFLLGFEADAAYSDIRFQQTIFGLTGRDRIEAFGSATARVGFAYGPALFYAKGGYGWASNRVTIDFLGTRLFDESRLHSGYTVGGGLEYMFAPNWSGKVEYMYADYGRQNYGTAFIPGGVGLEASINTVKGGINYRFGGPVVARY